MADKQSVTETKSQSDKFKAAARKHGADESETHWDERLRKLAKVFPTKPADS